MKAILNKTGCLLLVFSLFVSVFYVYGQQTTDYKTVSGTIKDERTKKKLEYASVTVPGTNIGTIANADGEFSIKIKNSYHAVSIEVSHIGYSTIRIPIGATDIENVTVFLPANTNKLKEVVVEIADPKKLVEEAIRRIGDNYSTSASLLTGFYRETVKKRRSFINISEAVVDIYKTSYNVNNVDKDRVQVTKGRTLLSPKQGDTLIVKLQGGPNLSIYIDIIKNPDLILNIENLPHYKFKMEKPVMIDEKLHYVVSFVPQVVLPYPLHYGTLYIDQETLTFSRAEFKLSMDDRNKATQAILRKKPFNMHFKPEEVSFLVSYRERDGRSYLHYVQSEVRFKCDWKRRLFSTGYTVVSEMVVTDSKIQNVSTIPNKLVFKATQILSDKVGDFYDENFWEGYNIIPPTESLESAIDKLKKQR